MNRTLRSLLNLGFVVTVTAGLVGTSVADPAEPTLAITLLVYNNSQIEQETLIQAEFEVAKIFRKIGIETLWRDATLSSKEQGKPVDHQSFHSSTPQLTIIISPRLVWERLDISNQVLGFALLREDRAYVFSDRVEHMVQRQVEAFFDGKTRWLANKAQILGVAMAHEVGHLLLGSNAHSPTGIMRASWNRDDLRYAAVGYLLFTPQQA